MPVRNYLRKRIYRWHRVTSLVVAVPILTWSLSGFLHPVMNSFKPEVRNQSLPVASIDTSKIQISLYEALERNSISSFHNFRIIKLDSSYYYQIQQVDSDTLSYFSCRDGKRLASGDILYASYLAQRYLSEPLKKAKAIASHGHEMNADINYLASPRAPVPQYKKAGIKSVELIRQFNDEYKSSNVLLPVYRVNFDRADDIRLYIETSTDRMATAIDSRKAWFIQFFAAAHTWSFLNGMGRTKDLVLGVFALLCLITSLLGYYVYNIVKKKNAAGTSKSLHRALGNVFVITTALYGFSGAWHAFHKASLKAETETIVDRSAFTRDEINKLSVPALIKHLGPAEKLNGISIAKMKGENYWQVLVSNGKGRQRKYLNTSSFQELQDGDIKYGCYLACSFSNKTDHSIGHSNALLRFTSEYSMMNKRLPVVAVGFKTGEDYYVETATGHLSAVTDRYTRAERFSFSNLHMHHYWEDFLGDKGKLAQKILLICSTLGSLLLAVTGCWMYWRRKRNSLGLRRL